MKISGMGLLDAWMAFMMVGLAVGAVIVGGVQGRNMAIVAVLIGIAFAVGFITRRGEDKPHHE